MSLQIKVDKECTSKNVLTSNEIHLMPCKIDHNGPAKVSSYFTPYISAKPTNSEEERKVLQASFRGRLLLGTEVQIPEDYVGLVLTESKKPLSEDAERRVHVNQSFQNFTYWNWDSEPSKNDSVQQIVDWLKISNAIHDDADE